MYKLVIQDDEGKTTVVPLVREEITVGRKEGNTIRLTERNVSRRHARIVRTNGAIAIEDLDSYNGVRVNGARIQGRHPLTVKDHIQIGDYVIEIKAEDAEDGDSSDKGHHTQPIDPPTGTSAGSSSSIPVMQDASDPDAQTVKMPAQMAPSGAGDSKPAPASNGSAAAVVATAAAIEETLPQPAILAQPKPQAEPAKAARLIVLSANFAGTEFQLTEPAMVIGRTEDNDIVVNHRSISRHHAKVVRENNHYAIVDLQSSNGVRVNDEDYGKVELRRGDIVDLGHVRMRFADPDDDYVFKPEDVNDVASGGGKGLLYAILAAVLVLGGIGIFALTQDGGSGAETGDETGTTAVQQPPTQPVNPVAVASDAAEPTPVPAPANAEDDPEALLESAKRAIDERKWAHAQVAADKLLESEPGHKEAKQIKQTAKREMLGEAHYQELLQAIDGKRYADISKKLASVPGDSVYHAQAQEAHDAALDAYVRTEVTPEAQRLLDARKCSQLQTLESRVRRQWSAAAGQLPKVVSECRAAVRASNRRNGNNDRQQGGGQQNSGGGNDPPPEPSKSFDELMTEAKDAAKANLYGKALRLCSDALKLKPGDQEAVSVCAIAACGMGNIKQAKRYHKQAIGARQSQIVQICMLKGVDLHQ